MTAHVVDDVVVLVGVGKVGDLAIPVAVGLAYMPVVLVDSQPVKAERSTVVGLVVEDVVARQAYHEAVVHYMAVLAVLHNCIRWRLAAAD